MPILQPPLPSPDSASYWTAVDALNRANDLIDAQQYRVTMIELERQKLDIAKDHAKAAQQTALLALQQRDLIVAQNLKIDALTAELSRGSGPSAQRDAIALALIAAGKSAVNVWAEVETSLKARAFTLGTSQ